MWNPHTIVLVEISTYPWTSIRCDEDTAEDQLWERLAYVLEQLEDLHHVHVPVVTLRVLDESAACEPDGDNGDHKEVEHAEDKDDDHVLQHRLELAALPD